MISPVHSLQLILLPDAFAVCRLAPNAPAPAWAAGPFVSITRTADELSVVCAEGDVPEGVRCERGWRGVRVAGAMDFGMVGVLVSLLAPLASAGVGVFAVSTFDTDYVLVRQADLAASLGALRGAGHSVVE